MLTVKKKWKYRLIWWIFRNKRSEAIYRKIKMNYNWNGKTPLSLHHSRRRCPSLFLTPRDDCIHSRRELIAASHLQCEEKRSRIGKGTHRRKIDSNIRPNNRSQIISDPRFDLSVHSFIRVFVCALFFCNFWSF